MAADLRPLTGCTRGPTGILGYREPCFARVEAVVRPGKLGAVGCAGICSIIVLFIFFGFIYTPYTEYHVSFSGRECMHSTRDTTCRICAGTLPSSSNLRRWRGITTAVRHTQKFCVAVGSEATSPFFRREPEW